MPHSKNTPSSRFSSKYPRKYEGGGNLVWGMGVLVHIFYGHNVVGGNTYSTYTKMGARIHRTVALRMRMRVYKIKWGYRRGNISRWYFFIFYVLSVVGNDTYSAYTKMGRRTHSAVPLRMRTYTHTITKRDPEITGSQIYTTICEEFSMRNA